MTNMAFFHQQQQHSSDPVPYGFSGATSATNIQQQSQPTAGGLGASNSKNLVSSATLASSDEIIKSQFQTREGTFKLMTLSEFSRPSRVPLNPHQGNNVPGNAPVRVSFVTLPESDEFGNGVRDFICFNVGRELYVYPYNGVTNVMHTATDLSRPIDKRTYKGTFPTCHDFNQCSAMWEGCSLLIGFSAGQIQLLDPFKKEGINRLFNDERQIDKTRVTCVRWIPGAPSQFIVSHSSGHLYVYNEEISASGANSNANQAGLSGGAGGGGPPGPPAYVPFKQGDGFCVAACKAAKSGQAAAARNPLYRWSIGPQQPAAAVNEFAFSPDGRLLATVGQDGFLRIFNYHAMECVGQMRSYFGGLLCVAWSPDMRYVATGGEDDLISVYSILEKRLVCRGQGHKSWVSQVAFDPYSTFMYKHDVCDILDSEEDLRSLNMSNDTSAFHYQRHRFSMKGRIHKDSTGSIGAGGTVGSTVASCLNYRIGSVGHDTMLCLWDLTEDILKPVIPGRIRTSVMYSTTGSPLSQNATSPSGSRFTTTLNNDLTVAVAQNIPPPSYSNKDHQGAGVKLKRHFLGGLRMMGGGGSGISDKHSNDNATVKQAVEQNGQANLLQSNGANSRVLGSSVCPHLHEVAVIEPLVNKKIAHERLTVLVFREDCIVTACQEGFVSTWARPGRTGLATAAASATGPPQHNPPGSPHVLSAGGGTVV